MVHLTCTRRNMDIPDKRTFSSMDETIDCSKNTTVTLVTMILWIMSDRDTTLRLYTQITLLSKSERVEEWN